MKRTFFFSQGIRLEGTSDASLLQFSNILTQICLARFTKFTWCQQVTLVTPPEFQTLSTCHRFTHQSSYYIKPVITSNQPLHRSSYYTLHKHWISLGQRRDCWPAVKVLTPGHLSLSQQLVFYFPKTEYILPTADQISRFTRSPLSLCVNLISQLMVSVNMSIVSTWPWP